VASFLLVSCASEPTKEEKMLIDYQTKRAEFLKLDIAKLDLQIESVEKVRDFKGSDSLPTIKKEFASYWSKNLTDNDIDTLSFTYVKGELNKLIDHYDNLYNENQKSVLAAIRQGKALAKINAESRRDKAAKNKRDTKMIEIKVGTLEKLYNAVLKKKDSVLYSVYKAKYSLTNPITGKKDIERMFRTNEAGTEFVSEE
jgi:hypothetical protein